MSNQFHLVRQILSFDVFIHSGKCNFFMKQLKLGVLVDIEGQTL